MSPFIFSLWAQRQQGGVEQLFQLLLVLLLFVVPTVIKFFGEKAAQKGRQRLAEEEMQKHLLDAFNTVVTEESGEEPSPVVRPKPKKERKRKQTDLVVENGDVFPTRGTLSRELAPQGEGSRFDVTSGTFDGAQILMPSVEPTVQPALESMTGIYDAPPGSDQNLPTPLAVDIFRMLTTPNGVRQAVVLGEILRRPELYLVKH